MNLLERVIKTMEIVKVTDLRVYDMEKLSPFFRLCRCRNR